MINSKTNNLVKHIKTLYQKKYREENKQYIIEGIKMVEEAIAENQSIEKIIVCEELLKSNINLPQDKIEYVTSQIFMYLTDTKTPQGVMAIINKTENSTVNEYDNVIIALDNIQDPGNLGTIIRTLDCAGIHTLVLSEGTVDAYNPKVVRSTMGAIFRVNIYENIELIDKFNELKKQGYKIVVTDLATKKSFYDLDYSSKLVIVIGNEANGVSEKIKSISDIRVKIPMLGRTESLNAGVATSLIAYEKVRKSQLDIV